jgi:hypothetical protein
VRPDGFIPGTGTDPADLNALGVTARACSLLVVRHADGRLSGVALDVVNFDDKPATQANFEFDMPGPGQPARLTTISSPTGFRWSGPPNSLIPEYAPPTP